MQDLALEPSPMVVKSIIEIQLKLYALPLNLSLAEIGFTQDQMLDLKRTLFIQFGKNIEVKLTDSVFSLSDKFPLKVAL